MDPSINKKIFLREFLTRNRPDLSEKLAIFITLCEAVRRFHAQKLVHNDINFDAFRIDPSTLSAEISESNLTRPLTENSVPDRLKAEDAIGGQPAYLAPERTGKTRHPVDFRSDLYSLGIVLYQLLTDTLPFEFTQPLKLMHAQIALAPVPACQVNPDIPPTLSLIISKLLAKSPTDRYQSAAGLIFDLKSAQNQLRTNGKIENFPLAQRDPSPFFEIPNQLYGRYKEIQLICDAYAKISHGKAGTVFISGPPGIGKSFLVENVQPFLLEEGGIFLTGKFDQFEKAIPYSAIIQAFSGLIQRMLTLSDADLAKRRDAILEAVGQNGQLLIDVIPVLELVIGQQPQPEKLSSLETRNRFNYVFQNFVRTLTKESGPVIIFLDDLQWADRTSLELMEAVLLDPGLANLLFIGAYRSLEAKKNPFLTEFLETITRTYPTSNQSIELEPVDSEYIEMLIKDMLAIDLDHSSKFIQLIAQKTNCNPLFIREFLLHLHKGGLIRFVQAQSAAEADRWEIDLEAIFKARLPDTILALLTRRIRKLSQEAQDILKIAACIGTEFSPNLLMAVYRKSVEIMRTYLQEALDQGIIVRTEDGYEFIHDRIREAFYQLNDEERRIRTHYEVGRTLMSEAPEKRSSNIFLLVSQLNSAIAQLSPDEREELIQLNLMAGKKAKEITAFAIAHDYFTMGLALLDESAWESHYELALALNTEAAETAYMCADFDEAENRVRSVFKNARSDLDQLKAYGIRLSCLLSQNKFSEILDEGLNILRRIGYRIPKSPGKFRLLWELFTLKRSLSRKTPPQLQEVTATTTPETLARNRIIGSIIATAYRTRPNLFRFIVVSSLKKALKSGISPDTAVYFAFYGLLLGAVGKIDRGYEFGQLALTLSKHPQITPNAKAQVLLPVNGLMLPWKKHFKETLDPLLDTYRFCMETGNLTMAAATISVYFNNLVARSLPLKEIFARLDHNYAIMRQYKQQTALDYLSWQRHLLASIFTGSLDFGHTPQSIGIDERAFLASLEAENDKPSLINFYFTKQAGSYFQGNLREAIKNSDMAFRLLKDTPPSVVTTRMGVYDSLSRLAHIRASATAVQSEKKSVRFSIRRFYSRKYHLAKVAANQKNLKVWCRHAPMNVLNKWNLVEAERADLNGRKKEAEGHYLQAIELSRQYGFLHEEALCNELLARFYLRNSRKDAAEGHFRAALDLNEKWGAEIQHRRLLMEYQTLFAQAAEPPEKELIGTRQTQQAGRSKSYSWAEMDLQLLSSVIDTISNKLSIKERLLTLSEQIMPYFGAQRMLLLINKEKLLIAVDNRIDQNSSVLKPVKGNLIFPDTIIQYVIRTREPVLLDHAVQAGMFASDPYICSNKAKSVLCIPLMYQGKLEGLLYLENNLSNGVFTRQYLEILTRLGGQIALFIENEFFTKETATPAGEILPLEQLMTILQDRYGLTPQEAKIAALFREGHTRDQIKKMLSISAATLRKHLQTIFSKTVNLEEEYNSEGRVDKLSRLILFLFKQF